jgi:hypothetical protein
LIKLLARTYHLPSGKLVTSFEITEAKWATASGLSLDRNDSDDDEIGRDRSRRIRTEAEELESTTKWSFIWW